MSGIWRCQHCGELIDPTSPTTGTRVVGWEFKALSPERRGGSDIKCREQLPEFIHSSCAERIRSGVASHQEALL